MSETMSNPTDWAKFYHHHQQVQQNFSGGADADASDSSAGMMTMMMNGSPANNPSGSSSNLSPSEGRVSKPPHATARRRSRASRRTPTTLLNTDTTNFRAMVQQFTGGNNINPPAQTFGLDLGAAVNRQDSYLLQNPTSNPNPSSSSVMFQSPDYLLQYQQRPQGYMISMGNMNNNSSHGDGFFHRLGGNENPRPGQPPPSTDGFLTEMNNSAAAATRVPSTSSSNGNRGSGFMF